MSGPEEGFKPYYLLLNPNGGAVQRCDTCRELKLLPDIQQYEDEDHVVHTTCMPCLRQTLRAYCQENPQDR